MSYLDFRPAVRTVVLVFVLAALSASLLVAAQRQIDNEWIARTEFGELRLTLNASSTAVTEVAVTYHEYRCGPLTRKGNVTLSNRQGWPFALDKLRIDARFGQDRLVLIGDFDQGRVKGAGTWQLSDSATGVTCSGSWSVPALLSGAVAKRMSVLDVVDARQGYIVLEGRSEGRELAITIANTTPSLIHVEISKGTTRLPLHRDVVISVVADEQVLVDVLPGATKLVTLPQVGSPRIASGGMTISRTQDGDGITFTLDSVRYSYSSDK